MKSYLVPAAPKLLTTRNNIMLNIATVTISPSQSDAIVATSALVLFIAVEAVDVTPLEVLNLSKVNTPTPIIIPTRTISKTNW